MSITPPCVHTYHTKMKELKQLKTEISILKPFVETWLNQLPNKSFQLSDVNIHISETKIKTPPTQKLIYSSLLKFIQQQRPDWTGEEQITFADKASLYIWDNRTTSSNQTLVYSQSTNKKRRYVE